jgi:hypothetical protein
VGQVGAQPYRKLNYLWFLSNCIHSSERRQYSGSLLWDLKSNYPNNYRRHQLSCHLPPPPFEWLSMLLVSLFENIFKLSQKIPTKMFRFSYSILYPRLKVKVSPQHAYRHTSGLQVWLHSFLNSVLDGSGYSTPHPDRLSRWKELGCQFDRMPNQAHGLSVKVWRRENLSPTNGVRSTTVQPVAKGHISSLSQILSPKLVQIINVNFVVSYFD